MSLDFPAQFARTQRFVLGTPRGLEVSSDDAIVLFLRSRGGEDPIQCLWAVDLSDGSETLIADPGAISVDGELPPAERARLERARESAGGVLAFHSTPDCRRVVFTLGGQLFLSDLARTQSGLSSTVPRRLPTADQVFDPRLDAEGTFVCYASGRDLRLIAVDEPHGDRAIAIADGQSTSWGQAEFIAAEEMGRSRGFWWAPDGTGVLATCVDTAAVERWSISDPFDPAAATRVIPYPAAGTANATVELWWLPLDGRGHRIPWDDGGHFEYLASVSWGTEADGSARAVIGRQNRNQTELDVATLSEDRRLLESRHTIRLEPWVELVPGSPTLRQGRLFTVEDRRDVDRRCLCVDGVPVSGPDLQIRSLIGIDADGCAIVSASEEPTEIGIYRFGPGGTPARIAATDGVHDAVLGDRAVALTSRRPEQPGAEVVILLDPTGGEPTADGTRPIPIASHAAAPVVTPRPRWFGKADELRSVLFLPRDHDGSTPLPVVLDPYGGPHAQRVLRTHTGHAVSQWLADHGFAVLVTDGRGTPGRSPSFEFSVHGDLAGPVLDDQITALDRVADRTGLFDLDRVGIRGWSFGGYLAALAVLRAPDRVHAAVAGAPVTSWRLYDTHYTERYLGLPEEQPEHYDRTDLILEAGNLRRPLLLIHGLADDNVVAAHTLQLSTALLGQGRLHSVLPLGGATHMASDGAVQENRLRLELEFLTTHLCPRADTAAGSGITS